MNPPVPHQPSGFENSTSQGERFLPALDPAQAPLDDRSPSALTAALRTFAAGLTYWSSTGQPDLTGLWPRLLPDLETAGLTGAETEAAQAPQKALALAFLRLYTDAQKELNAVTARHLDFHYRQVLGLKPRGPQPDHAHLVFALKRSAPTLRLPAGTRFQTKPGLAYSTDFEIIANGAALKHRRCLARDPATGRVRYAGETASLDGLGEPLPDDQPAWHPFGHGQSLPTATAGFAVSSPVLLLREGERTVRLHLTLALSDTTLSTAGLTDAFHASFSGEKEWLDAGKPTAATATRKSTVEWELTLTFVLPASAGPIVAFDPTVLEGGFDTPAPVLKVLRVTDATSAAADRLATAAVNSVQISVDVAGMKDLILEHDFGRIDPSKAFMPFGPAPRIGSSFYVNAQEALAKEVTSVKLHLTWNQPPTSFATRYAGYVDRSNRTVSSNAYFTADLELLKEGRFQSLRSDVRLFDDDATRLRTIDSTQNEQPLLTFVGLSFAQFAGQFSQPATSAKVRLPFATVPITQPLATLAPPPALAFKHHIHLPVKFAPSRLRPDTQRGFLRLRLKQDFLHDRYPELFADAIAHNQAGKTPAKTVPQPPYTPELSAFTLDYAARSAPAQPNAADAAQFASRAVRFFHLTPFGQREEHAYLKEQVRADARTVTLLPTLAHAGELYLGLTGVEAGESVSLLFQCLEGSANPLATREQVQWSVLCANHWKALGTDALLAETTRDFLVSGVVRLVLPSSTSTHNTLLEPGFVWLRAAVTTDITAVCRFLDIQPNAVPATLASPADATHLTAPLPPGSIVIAPPTLRGLKAVSQPYASFGGAPPESTSSFRIRTSERLRHRRRAVTAWDFEHLVLDRFPGVYRVKALPHTDRELRAAPGSVTLVLIPDTRGRSEANPLAPMTDLATLAEVEAFLASLHTPFAQVAAINPQFEPLKLHVEVVFKTGKPFPSFRPILNEDLQRHLSPWAFADSQLPDFGGPILRSRLLAFIESLSYVDYLTKLELHPSTPHAQAAGLQEVQPSTPASIITSASTHSIEPPPSPA